MKYSINILITLLLVSFSGWAIAALYKSIDDKGNVSYSQSPPKSGNYKTIKVKKYKPVATDAAQKSLKAQQSFEKGAQKRKESDLVKAELNKNKKIQQQNCEIAKKNLRLFTIYRRLKNDKGEFYRVTSTEKAQRVSAAKKNIKQYCK